MSAGYQTVRMRPFPPPPIPTLAPKQTAFSLLLGFILALALIFVGRTADNEPQRFVARLGWPYALTFRCCCN